VQHDSASTPENLVNQAIAKARKDPALMRNKAILQNMLQIAKEVGIKFNTSVFSVDESDSLDELDVSTVKSYSDKAKASRPDKLTKVIKRFAGQERAQDRIHTDALKKIGVTECNDAPLTFADLRAKHKPVETDDVAADNVKLHGHSFNPSSETHRKQLVNKLKD
jgi:uncharacterized protein YlxP (DUF503 family)